MEATRPNKGSEAMKKPTYAELQRIATSGHSVMTREEAQRMGLDLDSYVRVKGVVVSKSPNAVVVRPLDGKGMLLTFHRDRSPGGDSFFDEELHSRAVGDEVELRRKEFPD